MQFIDRMKKVAALLTEARDLAAMGPLDYLEKLVSHSEALLTKFSPIKCGSRAMIIRDVKRSEGWASIGKTLATGAVGVVLSVDYEDGQFVYLFVPDLQWHINADGHQVPKTRNFHTYRLPGTVLKQIREEIADREDVDGGAE